MGEFDKTMFGLTLFALSLSMLAISLDAFKMAGVNYITWTLYALGVVAGITMVIFFIFGLIVLLNLKKKI
jgi:hypothetical protein